MPYTQETVPGYPLKLHFQIPCFPYFFHVRPHIFHVPIYAICDYYIHKTDLVENLFVDLVDLSSFKKNRNFSRQYQIIFYFENQGIYNLGKPNSLCFGKISKFPVFSLTGNFLGHFPCFPCAVGTLNACVQVGLRCTPRHTQQYTTRTATMHCEISAPLEPSPHPMELLTFSFEV